MSSEPNSAKVQALYQAGLRFEADRGRGAGRAELSRGTVLLEPDEGPRPSSPCITALAACRGLGNNEAAEEHYNEVAAIDYGYIDVDAEF